MFLSKRKRESKKSDIRTEEGYTLLYKTYVDFVFDICFRYLGEEPISQNITSEIFTSIWERRNVLYKDDWRTDSWKRYLSKAAKHKIFDYLRNQEVSKEYLSKAIYEVTSFENTTEEELQYGELSKQVNIVVDLLPLKCREVYQLSREQGLSYKEISEKLSISVNAVNKHITKALKVLRDNLTDYQVSNRSTGS